MPSNQDDQVIEVLARSKDPETWEILDAQANRGLPSSPLLNQLKQKSLDHGVAALQALSDAGLVVEEKPNIVEYELLRNVTDEQRAQAGDSPLWLRGDIIAILINEGDAYLGHLQELPALTQDGRQDKGEEDNG